MGCWRVIRWTSAWPIPFPSANCSCLPRQEAMIHHEATRWLGGDDHFYRLREVARLCVSTCARSSPPTRKGHHRLSLAHRLRAQCVRRRLMTALPRATGSWPVVIIAVAVMTMPTFSRCWVMVLTASRQRSFLPVADDGVLRVLIDRPGQRSSSSGKRA